MIKESRKLSKCGGCFDLELVYPIEDGDCIPWSNFIQIILSYFRHNLCIHLTSFSKKSIPLWFWYSFFPFLKIRLQHFQSYIKSDFTIIVTISYFQTLCEEFKTTSLIEWNFDVFKQHEQKIWCWLNFCIDEIPIWRYVKWQLSLFACS